MGWLLNGHRGCATVAWMGWLFFSIITSCFHGLSSPQLCQAIVVDPPPPA
ncbi:unnamed protein product [Brassica rapa subsp. trilocularis]